MGLRGSVPPAHKLSSKVNIYTNMCLLQPPPRPETISKSGLGQTVTGQGQAPFNVPWEQDINSGHSAPLRGRDWVNPLWFSEVIPLTHQQVETSPLRGNSDDLQRFSLCLSSRGRDFRPLLTTLRALGRWRPVSLPPPTFPLEVYKGAGPDMLRIAVCSVLIRVTCKCPKFNIILVLVSPSSPVLLNSHRTEVHIP